MFSSNHEMFWVKSVHFWDVLKTLTLKYFHWKIRFIPAVSLSSSDELDKYHYNIDLTYEVKEMILPSFSSSRVYNTVPILPPFRVEVFALLYRRGGAQAPNPDPHGEPAPGWCCRPAHPKTNLLHWVLWRGLVVPLLIRARNWSHCLLIWQCSPTDNMWSLNVPSAPRHNYGRRRLLWGGRWCEISSGRGIAYWQGDPSLFLGQPSWSGRAQHLTGLSWVIKRMFPLSQEGRFSAGNRAFVDACFLVPGLWQVWGKAFAPEKE